MPTVLYSDVNLKNPTTSPTVVNVEAVYNSIYSILNTRKGEREFQPEFGCDIDEFLFEIIDDSTAFQLYQKVIEAIERWEERVSLDYGKSYIEPDYDNNSYEMVLTFTVKGLTEGRFTFQGRISND